MIQVSDYLIKRLEEVGVRHSFVNPNANSSYLSDSLYNCNSIQIFSCYRESANAIAVEAYARVHQQVGVLFLPSGISSADALIGVSIAHDFSTPLMVISGHWKILDEIDIPEDREEELYETDVISVVKPITKYAVTVTDPKTIRFHFERCLFEATHGKKGPVWLDIPLDIQSSMIDEGDLEGFCTSNEEYYQVESEKNIDTKHSTGKQTDIVSKYVKDNDVVVIGVEVQGHSTAKNTIESRCIGYDLSTMVGASVGGMKTVGIVGSEGFIKNIQELDTIRKYQLPLKVLVCGNTGASITKLSEAFGLKAFREEESMSKNDMEYDGPAVVELEVKELKENNITRRI